MPRHDVFIDYLPERKGAIFMTLIDKTFGKAIATAHVGHVHAGRSLGRVVPRALDRYRAGVTIP